MNRWKKRAARDPASTGLHFENTTYIQTSIFALGNSVILTFDLSVSKQYGEALLMHLNFHLVMLGEI